jgi:hypothetical protein
MSCLYCSYKIGSVYPVTLSGCIRHGGPIGYTAERMGEYRGKGGSPLGLAHRFALSSPVSCFCGASMYTLYVPCPGNEAEEKRDEASLAERLFGAAIASKVKVEKKRHV